MARIDIPFIIEHQNIVQKPKIKVASGGQNYFYATFNLCNVWDDIEHKKATFQRDDIKVTVDLVAGDNCLECKIPWEVMSDIGFFDVGVFGGDRLPTNKARVFVVEGCADGNEPQQPTPDWFSHTEQEINNIKQKIDSIPGKKIPDGGEIFNDYENNIASGKYSHASGLKSVALGKASRAEGWNTRAEGNYSHAEGSHTIAGYNSHAEGSTTQATGQYSHTEGYGTISSGDYSHAEGYETISSGLYSHSEGRETKAEGESSHSEGRTTTASGIYSHAEGYATIASNRCSHAEGSATQAIGESSHAEGSQTIVEGNYSHAEGYHTEVTGDYSHAEGYYVIVGGNAAHAEGGLTVANHHYSHAEGLGTKTGANCQNVKGKYNIGKGNTLVEVGNGRSDTERSNAFEVYTDGHAEVQVQGTTDNSVVINKTLKNYAIKKDLDTLQGEITENKNNIVTLQDEVTNLTKVHVATELPDAQTFLEEHPYIVGDIESFSEPVFCGTLESGLGQFYLATHNPNGYEWYNIGFAKRQDMEWEVIEDITLTEAVVGILLPVEQMNRMREIHIEGYIIPTDTTIASQTFAFNDGSNLWLANCSCKATGTVYLVMDIYKSPRNRAIFDGTISAYYYTLAGSSFKTFTKSASDGLADNTSADWIIGKKTLFRSNEANPMAAGTHIKIWGR